MYGQYAAKNNVRVVFPEVLDLTPFTTSGSLSTDPSNPISPPPPPPPSSAVFPRATTPTATTYTTPRTLYRLAAVVCHYGGHNSGHYVCFRRKPRSPSAGTRRFYPPRMPHMFGCECKRCTTEGPIRDLDSEEEEEEEEQESTNKYGDGHHEESAKKRRRIAPARSAYSGWLRISDDSVREVGLDAVLAEGSGAFMLYYERVAHPRPVFVPHDSTETLKPSQARLMMAHAAATNGSTVSLPVMTMSHSSLVDGGEDERRLARSTSTARIVRSVQAGRARSASAVARLRIPLPSTSEGSGDGDLTPKAADTRSVNGDTGVGAASPTEPLSSSMPALLPSSMINGHVSLANSPLKSPGVPSSPPMTATKKKRTKSSSKHRVHSPELHPPPHDHHEQQQTPSASLSSSMASSVSPLVDSKA
jgi:ubiquitin carboxyl-terminal hydrolase 1